MESVLEAVKESLFFNDLLKMVGIKLSDVKIYRHRGKHLELGKPIYNVSIENPEEFEVFQSDQSWKNPFSRKYLASFVETPSGETVFVGIYEIQDRTLKTNHDGTKRYWYDHKRTNYLSDLSGRIYVNWDDVYKNRQPALCAENYDFKIIKIRGESEREAFPGFYNFIQDAGKLNDIPESWKEFLENTNGIYLLTCSKNRKHQYVGKASGRKGFFGRWLNYTKPEEGENGNGGNKLLIAHNEGRIDNCDGDFEVTILEITSWADITIFEKEQAWMRKLGTKESCGGLNAN